MSNEADKPLAGALRAAQCANDCCCGQTNPGEYCTWCVDEAEIIARESGLTEILRAIEHAEQTSIRDRGSVKILDCEWDALIAAARRVREG